MENQKQHEMENEIVLLRARCEALEAERRWVPCSERMPLEGAAVLATGWKYLDPTGERWFESSIYADGEFRDQDDDQTFHPPTHWQPLPAPPQERP